MTGHHRTVVPFLYPRRLARGQRDRGRGRTRHLWVPLAALGAIVLLHPIATPATKEVRRILILNEAGTSYPAVTIINQGIQSALNDSPYALEFYSEYLDTLLFPDPAAQQEFRDFYLRKYQNRRPDVIVTVGPSPLKFMQEVHQKAFPGVPIVFCLPNGSAPGAPTLDSAFTGVGNDMAPAKTLEIALRLQPGTEHVVVVGGISEWDKQEQSYVKQQLKGFTDHLEITYMTDLAMPDLREGLRHLPSNTVVLFTAVGQDAAGTRFKSNETGPMIASAANAPVFTLFDVYINHGEVGGYLSNLSEQGKLAGGMALRLLKGEKPQDVPRVKGVNTYMFDWRALKRWGLKESNLPSGSIVLNRQATVWESYQWYIIGGIALVLAETLLLSGLAWQRAKRRRSERYSKELVLRSPLAMVVTRGPERRNELVNHKFTELFGYTIEDVPDEASWWSLAYPDKTYRESIKAKWEDRVERPLIEQTETEPMEASVRCKDGSCRQIEFHIASFADSYLVEFVDLTDRRRAESAARESEERFRLVANSAPVLIWMSGLDMKCDYFNQAWLDFTGRSLQAELGNGWAEAVHPDDVKFCLDRYTRAFNRRESFKMQYRLRRSDGEYRWVFDIGVPRFGADASFAGYIGSCIDVTDRKMAEDALARLSGHLIEAQEEERKRIAREIHDDYNQRLAMLAIDLEKLAESLGDSPLDVSQRLHELFDCASELSADLHSLSHRLHSSTLENLGLVAGVRAFCKEFAEQQGIQVDFAHEKIPRGIPADASLCIFRIVEEGLRNVKRHSGSNRAEVRLEWSGEALHLVVSDRGRGFDSKKPPAERGIGIRSMEERLRLLGGRLEIHSRPMEGARIEAWLPFLVAGRRAS
jgi:PAS domain S-box-containing protein